MTSHNRKMITACMSPEKDPRTAAGQSCLLCHKMLGLEDCCHIFTTTVNKTTNQKGKRIWIPTVTQIGKCPKGAGCKRGITPIVTFYHRHGFACAECAHDKAHRPDIKYFSHAHNGEIRCTEYNTFACARKEDDVPLNVVSHRLSRVRKHKKIRAAVERHFSALKQNAMHPHKPQTTPQK